jgi:hypothetical protein
MPNARLMADNPNPAPFTKALSPPLAENLNLFQISNAEFGFKLSDSHTFNIQQKIAHYKQIINNL